LTTNTHFSPTNPIKSLFVAYEFQLSTIFNFLGDVPIPFSGGGTLLKENGFMMILRKNSVKNKKALKKTKKHKTPLLNLQMGRVCKNNIFSNKCTDRSSPPVMFGTETNPAEILQEDPSEKNPIDEFAAIPGPANIAPQAGESTGKPKTLRKQATPSLSLVHILHLKYFINFNRVYFLTQNNLHSFHMRWTQIVNMGYLVSEDIKISTGKATVNNLKICSFF
jgi:hypothetical protein